MTTTTIYPLVSGAAIAPLTDTIKIALLSSAYTYADTDQFFSDVDADEVTGTGYTAGGVTVVVAHTYLDTTGTTYTFSADPTWTTLTATFRHAIIYKSTGTATTSPLISDVNFGVDQVLTGDDFVLHAPSGFYARLLS